VRQDLVGLALSGGGVRSASFNLGLLQALFRSGVLKCVDFLSMVSGGSYIGSFLASLPLKLKEKEVSDEMARHGAAVASALHPLPPEVKTEMARHKRVVAAILHAPRGTGGPARTGEEFTEELSRHAGVVAAAYGDAPNVREEVSRHAGVLGAFHDRPPEEGTLDEELRLHEKNLAASAPPLRLQRELRRHAERIPYATDQLPVVEEMDRHFSQLAAIYGDPFRFQEEMSRHSRHLADPRQQQEDETRRHWQALAEICAGGRAADLLQAMSRHARTITELREQPLKAEDVERELDRQMVPAAGQPERVAQMVRNGKYLNRPDSFTNLYLIGLFLNNLAIFSGLATLCMAIAYAWRCLDDNSWGGWLYLNLPPRRGWIELWRPFLPAALLFSLWFLAWVAAFTWAVATRQRPRTQLTRRILILAVAALLIAVAVVLATPVISIPDVGTDENPREGVREVSGHQNVIATTIFGLIVTALTPFLRPERLLQSGIHPKSVWEHRVFLIASTALLVGVPFILIWWFAHHDFAGLDKETRDRQVLLGDINHRKWLAFWERVTKEAREDGGSPGAFVYREVSKVPEIKKELHNPADGGQVTARMAALGECPVPLDEGERDLKQKIADTINSRVIGVYKDAVTGRELGEPGYESDFARHVRDYWYKQHKGELKPAERRALVEARVHNHGEWHRILALLDRLDHHQLTREERKELNRLMLEACYPEEVYPRAKVYRHNVIDADQKYRLLWLGILGGVFILSGWVNLNATSLHSFYRDRLAATFIEPIKNDDRTVCLSKLDTTAHGAPYLLFAGTLNRKPHDRDPSMLERDPPTPAVHPPPKNAPSGAPDVSRLGSEQPGETPTEVFLMSRRYCGSDSLGYRRTSEYHGGGLELDDAMAISGAAFSPVQTSNPLIGLLMTVLNMRLGQWLPNPQRASPGRRPLFPGPSVLALLWGWLCERLPSPAGDPLHPRPGEGPPTTYARLWHRLLRPRWYFVTDGGHHENLGLWSLLQRRCRLIIVSDASQDAGASFADLFRVLRRARFEKGIRVVGLGYSSDLQDGEDQDEVAYLLGLLRFAPTQAAKPGAGDGKDDAAKPGPQALLRSRRHFFLARVEYPAGETPREGHLVYLKPSLTGDEPAELQGYAALNADFPHNPTLDQLYDEDRFESYRQLGEHIGEQLSRNLNFLGRTAQHDEWPLKIDRLLATLEEAQEEALRAWAPGGQPPEAPRAPEKGRGKGRKGRRR
jgi:hypothetical protein